MNRFKEVDNSVKEVFNSVTSNRFPKYKEFNFKFIFDTKKRLKGGNVVLASIELANDKIKFLSESEEAPEGYDFIMYIDEKAWEFASDKDRERIMAHELCHIFINEKGKLKLLDHDIQDFLSEVKNNSDDPGWGMKLCDLVLAVYDQEKDNSEV